jgi:hypothetical protein
MEITKSTAQNAAREITICGRSAARTYTYVTVPEIRLMGKWLADIGFGIGDRIKIECENQKMVISLAEVQPWWEEREKRAAIEAERDRKFDRLQVRLNNKRDDEDEKYAPVRMVQ